jgi:hypothetical protein
MRRLPDDWLVLPGHRYQLSDGRIPTVMRVGDLLESNEAIAALDHDDDWNALPFLAFDDDLATSARRQRARGG